MTTNWFCTTCEERIEESEIEEHEQQGHSVRGHMVPDRLLSNDPWQIGSEESVYDHATGDQ